jgi:syringomycin synthetase protein SyrE
MSADQKRLLLAQMLRKQVKQPQVHPLSFGQERLWLLTRMDPDSPVYNISVAYHLTGPLEVEALKKGLESVAKRHDSLRTTFDLVDGQAVQRIRSEVAANLTSVDLRNLPAPLREREAYKRAAEEGRTSFDLGSGPLWRARLFCCSETVHVLVLTMHHIISDGWSFALLCQELGTLYSGFIAGTPAALPELPIQYVEFGQRQRQHMSGSTLQEHEAFWRKQFEEGVESLRLPTDSATGTALTHRGARQPFALSSTLSKGLVDLSQRETSTLFMTLLAGFQAVLHQSSGQEDLIVCTPVSGRHRSHSQQLIGYFNNILPLRCDLRGDPTLLDLVQRTRKTALDSYRYQDFPFLSILNTPHLRHVSLNRTLFSVDMEWPPKLTLAGLVSKARDIETDTSDFDLSVSIWEQDGQLLGAIKYKADLFEQATIVELISRYETVLQTLVANPETLLSSLPQVKKQDAKTTSDVLTLAPSGNEPPRTPLELRVAKLWEDVLGIQPIRVKDDLLSLGASSLVIAQLAERFQTTFNTHLPFATFFQMRTVEQWTSLLENGDATLPTSSLAAIQPKGTLPPLFLCEGVGIYFALAGALGADQPVYGLVTEVAENYPRMEELAAHYIAEIRTVQPSGPYYLGGVSFGGLVALEMAQQLCESGEQVGLLALLDTPGPGAFRPKSFGGKFLGHLSNLRKFGFKYLTLLGHKLLSKIRGNAGEEPDDPATQAVRRIAQGAKLRQLFEELAASYTVKKYCGRITLFSLAERGGMSDSLFDPALVHVDPLLGWGGLAEGGVELHQVPGEHVSMLQEPHVRVVGETLRRCLEQARTPKTLVSAS